MADQAQHNLKHADLVSYEGAAAGHDGVLSSSDGDLVIKPCTSSEVAFYQLCIDQQEPLYDYMPQFMGTLKMSTPEQQNALQQRAAGDLSDADIGKLDGSTSSPASADVTLKGKKLQTEEAIVLENVAAGFVKPSIMDLKLGSRLWADDAPPSKRQRMDEVTDSTTSGSLGFRIAGMRVWKPDLKDFKVYDKLFGRRFNERDVVEGFREYFSKHSSASALDEQERLLATRITADIERLRQIIEATESRMIGASILIVYEGDEDALRHALEWERTAVDQRATESTREDVSMGEQHDEVNEPEPGEDEDAENEDDDEGEEPEPRACRVAMIDFAHASIVPGQGRDENVLKGFNGVLRVLEELCRQ